MKRFINSLVFSFIALAATVSSYAQWTQVNIGTTIELRAISFASQNVGYIAADSGAVFKTTNGGMSWTRLTTTGVNVTLRALSFVNENVGVVVGDNATILRTTNGGMTWTAQTAAQLAGTAYAGSLRGVSFVNEMTGWISGELGAIQGTTNGGATWTSQAGDRANTTRDVTGIQFRNVNLGYAIARGGFFYRTTNGGMTWQESRPYGSSGNPRTQNLFFTSDNTGFVVGSPQSAPSAFVARTTTGDTAASAWTVQMTPIARVANDDPRLMSVHFADANNGVIASRRGFLLRTSNAGTTWTQETNPAGTGDLNSVWVTPNGTAFAVGVGGVLLRRTSITTSVRQEELVGVSISAQPNPANGSTSIVLNLPKASSVQIFVTNVLGQTIATLHEGTLQAGQQAFSWNVTNLPSGVYFYRASINGASIGGRVVVQ
ncbi:MAG: YCF48-related protein [Candidatus Kapabacteria bacterium]|jgi:photosystem II stability/assembly factor-like uncharacterized protein|nr:YCF48-related protein [Candidatus Kapabacteria bacterium]